MTVDEIWIRCLDWLIAILSKVNLLFLIIVLWFCKALPLEEAGLQIGSVLFLLLYLYVWNYLKMKTWKNKNIKGKINFISKEMKVKFWKKINVYQ